MKAQVLNYYNDNTRHTGFVFVGRKFVYAVVPEKPVRLQKIDLETAKTTPAILKDRPYPKAQALGHVRSWIALHGATQGVLKAIASADSNRDLDDETLEEMTKDDSTEPTAKKEKTMKTKSPKTETAPSVLRAICVGLQLDAVLARRQLRAAGLKAPYTDAAKIRAILMAGPTKAEPKKSPIKAVMKKAAQEKKAPVKTVAKKAPAKKAPAKKVATKKAPAKKA